MLAPRVLIPRNELRAFSMEGACISRIGSRADRQRGELAGRCTYRGDAVTTPTRCSGLSRWEQGSIGVRVHLHPQINCCERTPTC